MDNNAFLLVYLKGIEGDRPSTNGRRHSQSHSYSHGDPLVRTTSGRSSVALAVVRQGEGCAGPVPLRFLTVYTRKRIVIH